MYQFLRGQVTDKSRADEGIERLILDVNGIGYEIYTHQLGLENFGKKGEIVTVYTTLVFKEDNVTLYGFPTLIEREFFNLLCSVSGIGPKTALNLLGSLTVSEISYSILNEENEILCRAQGIGQRTASRIILELKDKIKNWKYLTIAYSDNIKRATDKLSALNEARSVLQSLGYSSNQIRQAFQEACSNGNHEDPESLIHFSIKWLSTVGK